MKRISSNDVPATRSVMAHCKGHLRLLLPVMLLSTLLLPTSAWAQVGLGGAPAAKSLLDLQSSNRALQVPRMTTAAKTTFTSGMNATHKGMVLFDSTLNRLEVWNGSTWNGYPYAATPPLSINPVTNTVALNPGTGAGDLLSWNGANWVNISGATYVKKNASNIQPTAVLNYCISLFGIFPSMNGISPFIGEIQLYGFNFAPVGFAFCNGQLLPISEYDALFALIGTTYGGDGQTTFALPDLRSRTPIHKGQGPGLSSFIIGQTFGTEKL
jgi:microcystin-dependent protein